MNMLQSKEAGSSTPTYMHGLTLGYMLELGNLPQVPGYHHQVSQQEPQLSLVQLGILSYCWQLEHNRVLLQEGAPSQQHQPQLKTEHHGEALPLAAEHVKNQVECQVNTDTDCDVTSKGSHWYKVL